MSAHLLISRIGIIMSILCLFFTFVIYMVTPSLRNLHGKSLFCYVSSLIIGQATFLINMLEVITIKKNLCIIPVILMQYSYISSFLWLNAMNYNIWRKFRKLRSSNRNNENRNDFKLFLYNCLYAWGCPVLISVVTVYMNFYPEEVPFLPRPDIGNSLCWLESKEAEIVYFLGIILATLFMNSAMVLATTNSLRQYKNAAEDFSRREGQNFNKLRFIVELKLFIVSGFIWIIQFSVFIIFGSIDGDWTLWTLVNVVHGLSVFLVFVCNKRVLQLLNTEFYSQMISIMNTT